MGFSIQSAKSKEVLNDLTQITNTTTNNVLQSASASCGSAINTFKLVIGGLEQCGAIVTIEDSTVTLNQTSVQGCNLNVSNQSTVTNQDYTDITTQIKQFIQQQLDSDQGWLSIGLSVQTGTSITKNDIQTRIDNITANDIEQSCNAYIGDSNNNNEVILCADVLNSTIDLSQQSTVTSVVQCSNKEVLNNFFNTVELQQFAQNTDQYFFSQQEGPISWLKYIIIGAIIIGVLLIIGAIIIGVVYLV